MSETKQREAALRARRAARETFAALEELLADAWEADAVRVEQLDPDDDITTAFDALDRVFATLGDRCGFDPTEPTEGPVIVALDPLDIGLLRSALDSHIYWQLSDEHYRDSGFVSPPGSDDDEQAEEITAAEALDAKLAAYEPAPTGEAP